MKILNRLRGKKRNAVTLALVLALAAILLVLNLLLPLAMHQFNWYVDLTPEGLYTATDLLKTELANIPQDVEIIFCAEKDYLFGNDDTRYPYIMCKQLAASNDRISIRYIDVVNDPSSADPYKSTVVSELAWDDIVVSAGGRYKILNAKSFYTSEDGEYVAYNGEYRIATAILSLTAFQNGPAAYFTYGHGERYYLPNDEGSDPSLYSFHEMLLDLGLRVGKINLDEAERVPEDCVLLIMCGPTVDYDDGDIYQYSKISTIEKIDRYLAEYNSFMIFRDALAPSMPALNEYLDEWGFSIDETHVVAPENALVVNAEGEREGNRLIAVYPDENTSAMGYSMFSSVIDLATPPETILPNAASVSMTWRENLLTTANDTTRCVSAVFYAGAKAEAYDKDGYLVKNNDKGDVWLAAVSSEAHLEGGEHEYSYVYGAGSTALISNEYLGDTAFGNGDVMFSTLRYLSRTDVYASSSLGGFDMNATHNGVKTYGGKMYEETHLAVGEDNIIHINLSQYEKYKGLGTGDMIMAVSFCLVIPVLAVPVTAFAVLRRRKHK